MRRLLVVLITCAAAIVSATPATASCVGPAGPGGALSLQSQLDAAPTVFVGSVIGTSNNDRMARVQVESVWKGYPIPSKVTVSGSPELGAAATSVDRTFQTGQRYLFAPSSSSSPFQDNSCSMTQPYSSTLDALRPAGAQPPAAGSDGLDAAFGSTSQWPLTGAVVLIVVLAVGGWLFYRRRGRPAAKPRPPVSFGDLP